MAYQDLETEYAGRKPPLFWLAVRTGLLTLLTLGLYRFWMKTRLRRYFWSAVKPGGIPMEYVGDPWEKLLGFLFAVVILSFYIGVVNLILMFFSFTLFQNNFAAYALSFAGVLPLIFFAQYRARRYVLARTRWRGIRFGMEPGAWGYTWRCVAHWSITIVSLGILWPRMTFWLEKYRVDRTFYGDQQMHQGGRWTMLIAPMKHAYFGFGASGAIVLVAILNETPGLLGLLVFTVPWAISGLTYWRAHSFRRLAETKEVGGVGFTSKVKGGRLFWTYMGGYILVFLSLLAGLLVIAMTFGIVLAGVFGMASIFENFEIGAISEQLPLWAMTAFGIAGYFGMFLFWGAAKYTFVTMPIVACFAETLCLTNPAALTEINQRARDEFAEAEGFADALDVGAAL